MDAKRQKNLISSQRMYREYHILELFVLKLLRFNCSIDSYFKQLILISVKYCCVSERQVCREKVGEVLTEKVLYIADIMNRHEYVPKMPNQSEIDLIFDTTYIDVQPYLHRVGFTLCMLCLYSTGLK